MVRTRQAVVTGQDNGHRTGLWSQESTVNIRHLLQDSSHRIGQWTQDRTVVTGHENGHRVGQWSKDSEFRTETVFT